MKVTKTKLTGVIIIEPDVFEDDRGIFKETFQSDRYKKVGIGYNFVQDNFSCSQKNVLRGLHYQKKNPQGKLASCSSGAVYDVVVDINPSSAMFGKYIGVELSEDNHRQIWVPPGYAHGFCVLTEKASFLYKCTEFYDPKDEGGIIWNDADINIEWPIERPLLSEADQKWPTLNTLKVAL